MGREGGLEAEPADDDCAKLTTVDVDCGSKSWRKMASLRNGFCDGVTPAPSVLIRRKDSKCTAGTELKR